VRAQGQRGSASVARIGSDPLDREVTAPVCPLNAPRLGSPVGTVWLGYGSWDPQSAALMTAECSS